MANSKQIGRCGLTAKQVPHRPGIAPALDLRAGVDGFLIVSQTASREDTIMNRIISYCAGCERISGARDTGN